jgi:hypothetical protein
VRQGKPADKTVRFLLRALPGLPFELVEEMAVVRAREDLHALRGTRAVEELARSLHGQRGVVLGDEVERRDIAPPFERERAGMMFGGVAVIEKRPYPASAQATEPSVVLKIPAEPMIAIAERHPAFIREMALMISRRLRDAYESVKALAVDPVEARLAATLLRLAGREGVPTRDGVRLPYHLTRQRPRTCRERPLSERSGFVVEEEGYGVPSRWRWTTPQNATGFTGFSTTSTNPAASSSARRPPVGGDDDGGDGNLLLSQA